MKTIEFKSIYPDGDILNRLKLNFDRLHSEWYKPEKVFTADQNGWSGDWEGRTVLALSMLGQSIHQEPKYLDDIISILYEKLNEKGYLGRILAKGLFDEQQISGHGWLLRGLVEYHLWKKDERILDVIKSIINNLMIPAKGYYSLYPSKADERVLEGEAAGNLTGQLIGNWYLSTDIGCAFIMLDGATQAYELLKITELSELIEVMIEKFLDIDLLGISAQTHATLSASRGILRYYECTKRPELLTAVERIFKLYLEEGITENYANYNWFGRPDWTEPCAVIDSFILATKLWQHTGKQEYIEIAHNIFYNAMGYSQRPNGGFGCDECAGGENEFISPKEGLFEAYWCCTMRGGEGLARALEYTYFLDDETIMIPFYNNNTAHINLSDGDIVLKQTTGYAVEGNVKIEVVYSNSKDRKKLRLFVPSFINKEDVRLFVNSKEYDINIKDGFVEVNLILETGKNIELNFKVDLRIVPLINKNSIKGHHSFYHGILMLGYENADGILDIKSENELEYVGDGVYRLKDSESILSPINDLIHKNIEEAKTDKRQILFKN